MTFIEKHGSHVSINIKMRELEQKHKFRRRMYSLPSLIVLLIITGAMVRGAYLLMVKERASAKDAKLLLAKVETLREREGVLIKEINKLETPAGVEEEIKSKFNVAKEGERVAVIVDGPEEVATTTPTPKPWYKRMWDGILSR